MYIIKKLKEEDKITNEQYKYLYPTTENVPRMYCTPKNHKPHNPLRPIVDYTGSIGYNVSRSLADLLAPIVGKTTHNITNSKHLASEMACVMIEQDEMFLSHDVMSLFTNTAIDDTLHVIRKRLEEDATLKLGTQLQVGDIMEVLQFVVTTTYFSFRGTIYQQKFGTAMGSLFMEWLEQHAIATAPVTCQPLLWKRYVDDVMEIVKKGCEQQLTAHRNTIDTTGNTKFTYEEERRVHCLSLTH